MHDRTNNSLYKQIVTSRKWSVQCEAPAYVGFFLTTVRSSLSESATLSAWNSSSASRNLQNTELQLLGYVLNTA